MTEMNDLKKDEDFVKEGEELEEVATGLQAAASATFFVALALNIWWVVELLKPTTIDMKVVNENIWKYQIANVVTTVVTIGLNMTAQKWQKVTMRQSTAKWDVWACPIGWAFAIWGIIFLFIIGFTIYQALPSSWVTSRNDALIFGQIGWLYAINQVAQGLWLIVWQYSNLPGFLAGNIVNFVMIGTGFVILQASVENKLNSMEFIFLRVAFSIYVGWLSAAQIVMQGYFWRANGFCKDQNKWGVGYFLMAFVVYNVYSYATMNPVFGLIGIWATKATVARTAKEGHAELSVSLNNILKAYTVTWVGQVVYTIVMGSTTKITYGLLY